MNIEITNSIQSEDLDFIVNALSKHDDEYFDNSSKVDIALYLKDEKQEIQGGLIGGILYETLYVNYFWVSETLRGTGYGKKVFEALEEEAKKRDINAIYLDTFTFQAEPFYKKLGFEEVGRFTDFPRMGVDKIFLKKELK